MSCMYATMAIMRTAEVEVNKRLTFKVNDREYKDFRRICLERDEEVAFVLRRLMREYVEKHKSKN